MFVNFRGLRDSFSVAHGGRMWNLLFIVILALGIGIRWYWAEQKEGMHMDEISSFCLADGADGAYVASIYAPEEQSRMMSGLELKKFFFLHGESWSDVQADLCSMHHKMGVNDHTNFYYSILRVFFAGVNTTDVKEIMLRGIALNLIFFIASFFVFWRILKLYYADSQMLIACALTSFAFLPGAVSDALFIRPYELQMLTVFLLAWWLSKVSLAMADGSWHYNLRNFLLTSMFIALELWTGYFMVLFVALLGAFLLLEAWKKGQLKVCFAYAAGAGVTALLICWLCYENFFIGFQGDGRIAEKLLSDGALERVWQSVLAWKSLLLHYTMSKYVLVVLFLAAILGWRHARRIPFIVLPALIYTLIVMLFAPYLCNRYMVAVTPLLLLLIPAVLSWVRRSRIRLALSIIIVSIYGTMSVRECNIEHIYWKTPELQMLNEKSGQIHIVQQQQWELKWFGSYLSDDVVYDIAREVNFETYAAGDIVVYSPRHYEMPTVFPKERFEKCGTYGRYMFYRVKEQPESAIGSFGNN